MRRVFLLITIFSLYLEASLTTKELATSINLAGKQRMLTQKMTKEALLIQHKIDREKNRKSLKQSSKLFDKILKGLINGDKNLKLKRSDNKDIQKSLKEVKKEWGNFYKRIQNILKNKANKTTYNYLINKNKTLLTKSNDVVKKYVKLVKASSSKRAQAVNLAGKERMLTQNMAKNILLNSKSSKKEFKSSKKLFEKILNGLLYSDKSLNLKATKLPKIKKALKKALKEYQQIDFSSKKSIYKLDHLLITMDNIVKLYEKSIQKEKKALKLSSIINSYMNQKNQNNHIINLAGKQRMLTQKMTKEALLLKIEPSIKESLKKSYLLYDQTLNGLLNSDKKLQLPKCKNKKIISEIKSIKNTWVPFKKHIINILNQSDTKKSITYIIEHNMDLLNKSNKLVQLLKRKNKTTYLEKARLNIVDIAGRERMLTQKMTKEKLLILQNIDVIDHRKNLDATKSIFENSLRVLLGGDKEKDIPKPTSKKIKKSFADIKSLWEKIKPMYERKKLSKKEIIDLNKKSVKLLQKIDYSVKLCENIRDY